MTTLPYQDLLPLVRQLPQSIQLRLAEELVKMLRAHSLKKTPNVPEQSLVPVIGLTKLDELLAKVDRIALWKARALYTLPLKQDNVDQLL